MPWHVEKRDDEFCVIKDDDDSSAGCHATRDAAEKQMAALYANEGSDKGIGDARAFVALSAEPIKDGRQWIEVLPTAEKTRNGRYYFTITADDLETYAESIRANAGQISVDRDHDTDEGRSSRAAGWFVGEAEVRDGDDGPRLWALVEWTKTGLEDVENKEFRFISAVHSFEKIDSKTGLMTKAKAILRATLTNNPFFKELAPVTAADLNATDPAVLTLAHNLGKTPEEIIALAAQGSTVWDARFGLESVRERLHATLNPRNDNGFEYRYWVMDVVIAAASGRALVRDSSSQATFVASFDIGDDGEVKPAERAEWTEARQEWVAAAQASLDANESAHRPVRSVEELAATLLARRSLPAAPIRRRQRVMAGVSRAELATTCGATVDDVAAWEEGKSLPEGATLVAYASALKQFTAPR